MRDQIKGPPVPRAQKWWSPSRAKRELKITDSTALAPGRAPAVLISVVTGSGRGKRQTAWQGTPGTAR